MYWLLNNVLLLHVNVAIAKHANTTQHVGNTDKLIITE